MMIVTGKIYSCLFTSNNHEVLGIAKVGTRSNTHKIGWCDVWSGTRAYRLNDRLRIEELI